MHPAILSALSSFPRQIEELVSIDTFELAKQRRYAEADPAEAFRAFATARAATVELVRGLSADQLSRRGVFDEYGQVTVRILIHFLCSHDQQHLAGLQWLLGKIHASS